jgi:hypothetical protein
MNILINRSERYDRAREKSDAITRSDRYATEDPPPSRFERGDRARDPVDTDRFYIFLIIDPTRLLDVLDNQVELMFLLLRHSA